MTSTLQGVLELEQAEALCERILAASEAEQTEVVIAGTDSRLTRFANSEIHQNVAEYDLQIRLRVVVGQRVGVSATNVSTEEGIAEALATATRMARLSPENPDFRSLPSPQSISPVGGFSLPTAECSPEDRARRVEPICRAATRAGLLAFGAFRTEVRSLTVANSLGAFGHHVGTSADLNTVVMGEGTSGYAAACSSEIDDVDGEAVGREAVERALLARNPRDLAPGTYPVLLLPYAVADLVDYLAYMAFSATDYLDGTSCLAGRLGERVAAESISLVDDGLDPEGLPMPFDYEGTPKRRVALIERGVARAVVHDQLTAGRAGTVSTGHALPAPNPSGPLPTHLQILPGDASFEAMLAALDRGLLVTRFHYVNVVSPKLGVLTGMTRDGTFWVEGGRIVHPVKNLRFTQGALEALQTTRMVGRKTKLEMGMLGATRAPALLLDAFGFSGRTEFP